MVTTYRFFFLTLNLKIKRDYTFFSSTHRTFSRMEHMQDHKTNLNKLKRIVIIESIFSDHNEIN